MKIWKALAGSGLFALAAASMFAACGTPDGACTFDTDCDQGFACEEGVCAETCTTNDDCLAGEECVEGTNTEQLVCKPTTMTNNGTGTNNGTMTNNGTGTNNGTPSVVAAVQVRDASTGAEACDDVNDPGSDLSAIELTSSEGVTLGWGAWLGDNVTFEGNEYTDPSILDGSAPSFGSDNQCVEDFNDTSVVALGCGGWLAVEFLDAEGNVVPLEAGMDITVYEYGGVCSTGSTADEYDVFLCTGINDLRGGGENSDTSCTINLGGGEGPATFTLTEQHITSAQ